MMAETNNSLREVIRLGTPSLREASTEVPDELFGSAQLEKLSNELIETMLATQGVGLAAPQIGENLRLFAYWLPESGDEEGIEPTVLVNPEIRPAGSKVDEDWEGCLSVPGLRGLVPRHFRIKVKARDTQGELVSMTADGFHARVLQHEYDHLDGVIYIDRMESNASLTFEEEWARYVGGMEEDPDLEPEAETESA